MKVPLLDLKPQYRALKTELDAAILRVSESQHFILGPEVKALEAALRCVFRLQVRHRHVFGHGRVADRAHGARDRRRRRGHHQPLHVFRHRGHHRARRRAAGFRRYRARTLSTSRPRPIEKFIESQCETRNGVLFNRATGGRVRAMMPVHLYGQVADMTRIMDDRPPPRTARHRRCGAGHRLGGCAGRRACSIGDIGCLSFFPTKNLGAFGDAGMCVTNDEALAAKLMKLRVHGMEAEVLPQAHRRQFPPRRDPGRGAQRQAAASRRLERGAPAQRGVLRRRFRARGAGRSQYSRRRRRRLARATSTTSTASARSGATNCATGWRNTGSAPRSTIRCRCTCSSVSPISAISRRTFRSRCAPRSENAGAADLPGAGGVATSVRGRQRQQTARVASCRCVIPWPLEGSFGCRMPTSGRSGSSSSCRVCNGSSSGLPLRPARAGVALRGYLGRCSDHRRHVLADS